MPASERILIEGPAGAIEVGTQNDTGSMKVGACVPPPMRQASPTGSP